MLILVRKPQQSIIMTLGETRVTFKILSVKGSQIRIGITAPGDVSVHREEIQERIDKEAKWIAKF